MYQCGRTLLMALILLATLSFSSQINAQQPPDGQCRDAAGGPIPCPDADGDGIPDHQDSCPTTAGTAANAGCPETVPPTAVPAPTNPDRDGDGVPDSQDSCPDQAGSAANGGCPETTAPTNPTNPDRDGDGVPDSQDNCPDQAGSAAGCVPAPEVVLPALPAGGACVVATQDSQLVNVRERPATAAQIVARLDPQFVYTVIGRAENAEGLWFQVEAGWVASWVLRLGGDCEAVPSAETIPPTAGGAITMGQCEVTVPNRDAVPLLAAPHQAAAVIGSLAAADQPFTVVSLAQNGDGLWYQIGDGWVNALFVTSTGVCPDWETRMVPALPDHFPATDELVSGPCTVRVVPPESMPEGLKPFAYVPIYATHSLEGQPIGTFTIESGVVPVKKIIDLSWKLWFEIEQGWLPSNSLLFWEGNCPEPEKQSLPLAAETCQGILSIPDLAKGFGHYEMPVMEHPDLMATIIGEITEADNPLNFIQLAHNKWGTWGELQAGGWVLNQMISLSDNCPEPVEVFLPNPCQVTFDYGQVFPGESPANLPPELEGLLETFWELDNVYAEPSFNAIVTGVYGGDTVVDILSNAQGTWFKLEKGGYLPDTIASSLTGSCSPLYLPAVGLSSGECLVSAATSPDNPNYLGAPIYSAPNLNAAIVGYYPTDSPAQAVNLTVQNQWGIWYHVEEGWVMEFFLSVNGNCPITPPNSLDEKAPLNPNACTLTVKEGDSIPLWENAAFPSVQVGSLIANDEVIYVLEAVQNAQGIWYRVEAGWAFAAHVETEGTCPMFPVRPDGFIVPLVILTQ